jgi:hypothetical protein
MQAFTNVSVAATNRFWNIDRIMFGLSPYITDEESWKIVEELNKMGKSRTEGNFTASDALLWVAEQVGPDRWQAICQCWTMDNQNAIKKLYSPEQLRTAWVHKIFMTEGTPEQIRNNPRDYIEIQTTRESFL